MSAELIQLWWGPCEPPLWARNDGLETHSRDQLSLDLMSAKPSLLSRIKDMESFDLAFVLEERSLRAQGRSPEAHRFREQLDQLPYFKKIRASGTSLGDLQACVALSKLRPGGWLWWAREEALGSVDGQETLRFLLDRGQLTAEWDFSRLEHGLPLNQMGLPLFPRHLYLFQREPRIEERHGHRPLKLTVQGQLRSHVELPLALRGALLSKARPQAPHAHWQIHAHVSPSRQKDWLERWPDHDTRTRVVFITQGVTREALREIKGDPELRDIPILVLTTSKAEEDIFRTYQLGVNSFITKPVTFDALLAITRDLGRYWFEIVELPNSRGVR
jgi:hypothetical protein